VDFLSWSLLSKDQRAGAIALAGLPFSVKLGKLSGLYRHRVTDSAALQHMDELRRAIEAMNEERNRLLHAGWAAGGAPGVSARFRYSVTASRGYVQQTVILSREDVNALADRCLELATEVMHLIVQYLDSGSS